LVYPAAKLPVTRLCSALMTADPGGSYGVVYTACAQTLYRRVAAVMLILLLVSGGCAGLGAGAQPAAGRALVQRVECTLSAGADSMELKYALQIRANRPSSFRLLDESAVLVSTAKPNADVTIQAENGHHFVQVDKPGTYSVEAVFLAALPPAGEDQQRRFELALPVALTNRVRLVIPDANVSIEAPEAVFAAGSQQPGQTSRGDVCAGPAGGLHVASPGAPGRPGSGPLLRAGYRSGQRHAGIAASVPRRPPADRAGADG
jgi:hypothetical protein